MESETEQKGNGYTYTAADILQQQIEMRKQLARIEDRLQYQEKRLFRSHLAIFWTMLIGFMVFGTGLFLIASA